MMFNNLENLKQYLLGNLNEKKTEKIDIKVISDENFEEKLLIAEHSLIEDFIEQNLSPEEVNLFHKNFLISAEREKMVEQVAALKRVAKRKLLDEENSAADETSDDGFFQNLFRVLTLQPARGVLAALIIGLFFGAVWVLFLNENKEFGSKPLEMEFAKLNKENFSELEKYKSFSKLNLIQGVSRSAEKADVLEKDNLTSQVLTRLALPPKTNTEELFKIQILFNETPVFTQNQIHPVETPTGKELRFLMPASVLKKGDYLIKARNEKTSEIIYSFLVE